MRNLSYENQVSSQVHSDATITHFHLKGLALGLVFKPRQKATRKWPIECRKGGICDILSLQKTTSCQQSKAPTLICERHCSPPFLDLYIHVLYRPAQFCCCCCFCFFVLFLFFQISMPYNRLIHSRNYNAKTVQKSIIDNQPAVIGLSCCGVPAIPL